MSNKIKLDIRTKRNLFLNTTGEHKSVFNGDGLDFREIREYDTSDDIRHINWKVTARRGTASVNIFNEDKQLNIVLVYLNSGSLYFGSIKSKQDTAIEILNLLASSALQKNDLISTTFFSNDEQKFFKATKNKKIVNQLIDTAYELDPIGNTIDYKKLGLYLANKIKKKSLIFIIGDFLEIPDFKFLSKKHEIYCAIVRDNLEEDLKLSGEYNFINTNNKEEDLIYLDDAAIVKYNKLMREHDQKLFSHFVKSRIKYHKIYTSDNIFKSLSKLVKA